jgi:hypothetical protein
MFFQLDETVVLYRQISATKVATIVLKTSQ